MADPGGLRIRSCRDLCEWRRTPARRGDLPLFACRGCGSQWAPGAGWTPADRDGRVPGEVLAVLRGDPPG